MARSLSALEEIAEICPRPAEFCELPLRVLPAKPIALRFFKSDRLLEQTETRSGHHWGMPFRFREGATHSQAGRVAPVSPIRYTVSA